MCQLSDGSAVYASAVQYVLGFVGSGPSQSAALAGSILQMVKVKGDE